MGCDAMELDWIALPPPSRHVKSSISSSYKSFCVYDYLDDGTRLIIGKRLNSRDQMTIDGYCQWVGLGGVPARDAA